MLVVSKDIKEAVLEERHPAKRIKGKSAPTIPTFTEEQVKAKVTAAEMKQANRLGKLSSSFVDQLKGTINKLETQVTEDIEVSKKWHDAHAKLKSKVGEQKTDITRLRQERNKAREAAGGAGGTTTPKAKAAGSGVPMTPAQRGRSRTPAR